MTPLQMRILLDVHCGKRTVGELCPTDTHREQMMQLFDLGLVDREDFPAVTAKGRAWIERALNTPMPVQAWVFPDEDRLSASMLGIPIPPYPMPAPTAPKENA